MPEAWAAAVMLPKQRTRACRKASWRARLLARGAGAAWALLCGFFGGVGFDVVVFGVGAGVGAGVGVGGSAGSDSRSAAEGLTNSGADSMMGLASRAARAAASRWRADSFTSRTFRGIVKAPGSELHRPLPHG